MKHNLKHFNLVEIIIAMGIIVVCLTTVMGLFATGIKISKDAVLKTYSSMIVEQMGGLVETYPNVKTQIPTIATTGNGSLEYPDANSSEVYKQTYADLSSNNWDNGLNIQTAENACTTAIDAQDPFFKNVYYNDSATDGSKMGLMKIEFQTTVANGDTVDFTAWVRMWWSSTTDVIIGSDDATLDVDKQLIIEISWAGKTPYKNRVLSGQIIQVPWRFQP